MMQPYGLIFRFLTPPLIARTIGYSQSFNVFMFDVNSSTCSRGSRSESSTYSGIDELLAFLVTDSVDCRDLCLMKRVSRAGKQE